MARTRTLPLTLVLVLLFSLSAVPARLAAQDDFNDPNGAGISIEPVEGAPSEGGGGKTLEQYIVTFEPTAYLPENRYPEAMVVKVQKGSFAIRVGEEDLVIVDPAGRQLSILESADYPMVLRNDIGVVTDVDGNPCETLCALPPNQTVLVEEGSTLFIPEMVTCFLCNISGEFAELLVYPAVLQGQKFSWTLLNEVTTVAISNGVRVLPQGAIPGRGVGCM